MLLGAHSLRYINLYTYVKAGFQSVKFRARGQRAEFFRRILLRAD
jgi:hypothetical protein